MLQQGVDLHWSLQGQHMLMVMALALAAVAREQQQQVVQSSGSGWVV